MDIQATKIELIKQLLDVKKESVLNKIQDILSSETSNSNETLAYTSDGKPLTKEEYIQHIKKISQEIENGAKTYASEEVQNYVLNKNRK